MIARGRKAQLEDADAVSDPIDTLQVCIQVCDSLSDLREWAKASQKNVQSAPVLGADNLMDAKKANRTEWRDFPDAVIVHSTGTIAEHIDYQAAKSGDVEAALRLVDDFLTREALLSIKALIDKGKGEMIVAVHAEELSGRNQIPIVFATLLESYLGVAVDEDIVQAERAYRTGADGFGRLVKKVLFEGTVIADARYLIVDDAVTQGGTIADLKGYIEENGGVVIGVVALMGKPHSAKLAITKATLGQLRKAAGQSLEVWWYEQFGYDFSRLTESEARYIAKQIHRSGIDAARDRLFAARQTEYNR
ncbi:MAG: phosphoribosyltransferase [Pseudomonadota bacterium]|nr:phosphoribosyltransferase [Pseudomonadota bacterium]